LPGRLTPEGSAFELWDLFVRFRSYVWTGQTDKWQASGQRLYELLELRERTGTSKLAQRARLTRYRLSDALQYLETNIHSLIDYRRYKQEGRRISTGFVESTINRVVGRRMCKGQQMRWSRSGADGVVQVRVAVQNREFDDVAKQNFSWRGSRRVSWPWMQPSHPFLTASFDTMGVLCDDSEDSGAGLTPPASRRRSWSGSELAGHRATP